MLLWSKGEYWGNTHGGCNAVLLGAFSQFAAAVSIPFLMANSRGRCRLVKRGSRRSNTNQDWNPIRRFLRLYLMGTEAQFPWVIKRTLLLLAQAFSVLFAGNFAGTYFCSGIIGRCRLFGRNIGFEKIGGSQRTRDRVLNLPLSDWPKIKEKARPAGIGSATIIRTFRFAKSDG